MTDECATHRDALTKLTVNMRPRAMAAIDSSTARCGGTKTETINRAVQLYDAVTSLQSGAKLSFDVTEAGDRMTVQRVGPGTRAWITFCAVFAIVGAFLVGTLVR